MSRPPKFPTERSHSHFMEKEIGEKEEAISLVIRGLTPGFLSPIIFSII